MSFELSNCKSVVSYLTHLIFIGDLLFYTQCNHVNIELMSDEDIHGSFLCWRILVIFIYLYCVFYIYIVSFIWFVHISFSVLWSWKVENIIFIMWGLQYIYALPLFNVFDFVWPWLIFYCIYYICLVIGNINKFNNRYSFRNIFSENISEWHIFYFYYFSCSCNNWMTHMIW